MAVSFSAEQVTLPPRSSFRLVTISSVRTQLEVQSVHRSISNVFLQDIGFNVAVLLTNLSEHMPHDTRLQTFLALAESVLDYFQPYLGRIEIMGSAKRIERVYFEISESSRTQWEKPQVSVELQSLLSYNLYSPFISSSPQHNNTATAGNSRHTQST